MKRDGEQERPGTGRTSKVEERGRAKREAGRDDAHRRGGRGAGSDGFQRRSSLKCTEEAAITGPPPVKLAKQGTLQWTPVGLVGMVDP